jgi:hypothetical protein
MDTGDVILHRPTGEQWLVAYVQGDRLVCCGWPETAAPVSDCELLEAATPEQRLELLHHMAAMSGSDSRKSHALQRLETAEDVLPNLY